MTTETTDGIADGRPTAVGADQRDRDGRAAVRDRATRWRAGLTVAGWLLAIAILIVATLLWARSGFADLPQVFMTPLGFLALGLLVITQASAGVILAVRRPDNVIGSIVVTFALAVALAAYVNGYVALAGTGTAMPWDPVVVALLLSSIAFSLSVLMAVLLGLLFPTGHLLAPAWRVAVGAAIGGSVAMAAGLALTPGRLLLLPGIQDPVQASTAIPGIGLARGVVGPALLFAATAAAGVALVRRYRLADEVGRLQLRWYVASGVLLVVGFFAYLGAILLLPPGSGLGEVILVLFLLSASLPPVALVFSILRYHLYDIDAIIGRTFVYGALTAILAGLYAASVRLFNALFVDVTGQASEITLVITTLILATTFTPIKNRLEDLVDRRMKPVDDEAPGETHGQAALRHELFADPAFIAELDRHIRSATAGRDRRRRDDGGD